MGNLPVTTGDVGAPRRIWRSIPGAVWLATFLWLLVMVTQTAVFPNFWSPDERQQVDLIVMTNQGHAWPWPEPGTMDVSEGSGAGGFTTLRPPSGYVEQWLPARGDRPSYQDAGGAEPSGGRKNQLVQHPPLYYLAGAAVLVVVPDWQHVPFDLVYLVLRLWNVLIMLPLPILLWATARRLKLPDPLPVAAALVPLVIPGLSRGAASVNNDNLLVILAAVLTYLTARVLTGDTSRRTALAIGVVGSLALLTKGLALVIPLWVAAVYLVAAFRFGRRTAVLPLVVAGAAMIPGVAWWVRNKLVYGVVQPNGLHPPGEAPAMTPRYGWSDGGWDWLVRFLERMNTTYFVQDQTNQRLHNSSWWMAVVAGVLVLLAVAVVLIHRRPVLPRATTVVLLLPTIGCFAIVAMGVWEYFAATREYTGMQGRYLFPGVVGVGVVAVAATARLPGRARRFVPLAVLLFAVVIESAYFLNVLQEFWRPRAEVGLSALWQGFLAIGRWYALPAAVLVCVVALAAATVVVLAIALVRAGQAGAVSPPPDPSGRHDELGPVELGLDESGPEDTGGEPDEQRSVGPVVSPVG